MNLQRYRGGRGCRCPSSGIDLPSASLRGEPAARLRRARTRLHVAEHSSGGASAPSPQAIPWFLSDLSPPKGTTTCSGPLASTGALSPGGGGVRFPTGVPDFRTGELGKSWEVNGENPREGDGHHPLPTGKRFVPQRLSPSRRRQSRALKKRTIGPIRKR